MITKLIPWVLGAGVACTSLALMATPARADRDDGHDRGRSQQRGDNHDRGRRDDDHGGVRFSIGDRDRGSGFSFHIEIGDRSRPAPVIYSPPPARVWVPAHYEERNVQVLVEPARVERQYVPPVVDRRYDRWGHPYEVVVQPGWYCDVRVPARYETRCEQVLVPGHWEVTPCP